MTKTYTQKSNAVRAARAALGADAKEGEDFAVGCGAGNTWTWVPKGDSVEDPEVQALAEQSLPAEPAERKAAPVYKLNTTLQREAERIKADRLARKPKGGAKAPKDPTAAPSGKAADLVAKAKSATGISLAEVKAMTGWTKLGGFYGAVKKAGLTLRKEKVDDETRYFAMEMAA